MASKELFDETEWAGDAGRPAGAGWRAAQRHSRMVRALRIGLPLVTLVIVAGMALSLRSLPTALNEVELGEVGMSGSTLSMDSPRLVGYGARGMSYEVDAARALQDLTSPHVVRLQSIAGRVQQPGGGWATLKAESGLYDSQGETLRLDDDIEIEVHDGKRGYFREADVDLKAQRMVSEQPVRLEMPGARIRADRMEVWGSGERVLLRGGVTVDARLDGGPLEEEGDAH